MILILSIMLLTVSIMLIIVSKKLSEVKIRSNFYLQKYESIKWILENIKKDNSILKTEEKNDFDVFKEILISGKEYSYMKKCPECDKNGELVSSIYSGHGLESCIFECECNTKWKAFPEVD